jgi:phage FluMu protein Com
MQARNLCNILSDAGILKSYLGATCPHCGRIVESYSQDDEMPDTTECENCEMNEAPNHIFTTHLHLVQFFTIADNTINAPCSTPTTSK